MTHQSCATYGCDPPEGPELLYDPPGTLQHL